MMRALAAMAIAAVLAAWAGSYFPQPRGGVVLRDVVADEVERPPTPTPSPQGAIPDAAAAAEAVADKVEEIASEAKKVEAAAPPHPAEVAAETTESVVPLPTDVPPPLAIPVAGIRPENLDDTFTDSRANGARAHDAIDIMAPAGTPVTAVADGRIVKLFLSERGGITAYQFDASERFVYYYAHLQAYAPGLAEGQLVHRGDPIGLVGSTAEYSLNPDGSIRVFNSGNYFTFDGFDLAAPAQILLDEMKPDGKLSDDVVKIGVLSDMSGVYADYGGPGAVAAAKLAVADFGGKMFGKNIEVVSADHQNKPDVGASKAREWFDTQGVDMIVDVPTSSVAIAVAKVANEKKRVFMNTGAATKALTNEECNPYTVHYAYDTYALANGTGKAVVQTGGKTWFFLTADYAFGHALEGDTAAVVKASGGEVKGAVRHPLSASDFSSFLLQAQASKAQIIGLANAGGDTINSVKAANEFGLTKNQTLAGLLMFITDVHSLGLKTAQGMMLTDAWYWDANDETRKFGKRFFEKMKRMPSSLQAADYSATMNYLKAVQAAGTDEAKAVMAKMREIPVNDVMTKNGKLREDGRLERDMYLFQVKTPAESKSKDDIYKLIATVPGNEAYRPMKDGKCPFVKS